MDHCDNCCFQESGKASGQKAGELSKVLEEGDWDLFYYYGIDVAFIRFIFHFLQVRLHIWY